jgi:hypothetical protein
LNIQRKETDFKIKLIMAKQKIGRSIMSENIILTDL